MIALVRVLIGSIARLLRSAAELLGRWATPEPAAPSLPSEGRGPIAAPEDWIRRAVPPPPAHWLDVVRARAPHFQPADPRAPRERRETPAPSPILEATLDYLAGSERSGTETPRTRAIARPAPAIPSRRPTPPAGGKPGAPARSRVVTVVEEMTPRRQRPSAGGHLPSSEEFTPKENGGSPLLSPHRRLESPWPHGEQVPEAPALMAEVVTESSALGAAPSLPPPKAPDPRPRSRATARPSQVAGGRWTAPGVSPELYPSLPEAPSSVQEPSVPESWPSLPPSAPEDPRDYCRELLREALLLDELDREQRGMPWSA